MADEYVSVGKLGKPHGIRGAFRFLLHRELKSKKLPSHFFLYLRGQYLPFFIKSTEWLEWGSGFIQFEEITTPEIAKLHSGKELYLIEKDTKKYFKADVGEWDFLVGYQVIEHTAGAIGVITMVEEMPAQILLTIQSDNGEHIIPLVDDFVVSIHKTKKEITLELPDGLLDL